ncbi:hypothetical protein M413DRAFT_367961 [Hebeloma cylindrosporum]|uniref:Aminoglycoside phosphotransferase domain-containing protein n=1 Tax=Hebeloma cylindrosporum TaxID=76867 RepID=A0A0C3CLI8_HEBCY|nr:hypothetical protein M413DRAFT_367961 [Hebeloma cylindrosporum h7]
MDSDQADESTLGWLIWLCSDALAQFLESLPPFFSAPAHSPSDIDDISDEELLRRFREGSKFKFPSTAIGTNNVSRVTEHTVMKSGQDFEEDIDYPSEALVLQLVAEQTSIPVPRVRRLLKAKDGTPYMALEHIPGHQLSFVWPTLSWFGRIRIAFKMHSYIRQLRKIRHPRSSIPGPMGIPGEGGRICPSPLWGLFDRRGPFATYADLTYFFNERLARLLKSERKQPPSLETLTTFDDTQPLVLTHQDLNPRNFIVGDDGHLWLVDWAWAGFYPPWFEYVTMRWQARNEEDVIGKKNPEWDAIIPFVCGRFFEHWRWIARISKALNWT